MITTDVQLQKQVYVPGEEVTGTVYFSVDAPMSYRSAKVSLIVKERTEFACGKATFREEKKLVNQEHPISFPKDEKGKIKPGEYDIHFSFALPQGLPLPYEGTNGTISYAVVAHIDIPYGVDVDVPREFSVRSTSRQSSQTEPVSAVSGDVQDPNESIVTFSLERDEFSQGENIEGRYTYRNQESKTIKNIKVHLKCKEMATAHEQTVKANLLSLVSKIPVRSKSLQGQGSFSIRIPEDAPRSFDSSLISVLYTLSVSLDIAMGLDVQASATIGVIATTDETLSPREGTTEVRRCQNCQTVIVPPYSTYCSNCGAALTQATEETPPPKLGSKAKPGKRAKSAASHGEECMVCDLELKPGEDVVWCPHCGNPAHRAHLIEWIRSKHACPMCRENLSDRDFR
jgi:sporulation-control protein spo0M